MSDGFHPPLEDYLEAVHEMEEEGVDVIQARLADRLGHTPPTVSAMVARLRADGYLRPKGRTVALTAKGRRLAESVVRKHRLAERLLVDVIGLAWHKAHIEAARWEHVISDDVEAHLVELLGNPGTCPHGNPIPGAPPPTATTVVLTQAVEGDSIRLERVTEQLELDLEALTYLDAAGFIPGACGRVERKAPDGTLTVLCNGNTIALGAALARELYVSVD